jgi:cellulose synthase/poly-beta-1,6-N-acetylglucosamine synthase-like glycosyltransferase
MNNLRKKIAFCISCMNRLSHIQATLEQNIRDNYLTDDVEFVLLDYHSTDGLEEWVQAMQEYITQGFLKYYRTTTSDHYERSHSQNMAFRLSNAEIVCKLDADNFLGEGFAYWMIQQFEGRDDIFYTSNHSVRDVTGRVCVRRVEIPLESVPLKPTQSGHIHRLKVSPYYRRKVSP